MKTAAAAAPPTVFMVVFAPRAGAEPPRPLPEPPA